MCLSWKVILTEGKSFDKLLVARYCNSDIFRPRRIFWGDWYMQLSLSSLDRAFQEAENIFPVQSDLRVGQRGAVRRWLMWDIRHMWSCCSTGRHLHQLSLSLSAFNQQTVTWSSSCISVHISSHLCLQLWAFLSCSTLSWLLIAFLLTIPNWHFTITRQALTITCIVPTLGAPHFSYPRPH